MGLRIPHHAPENGRIHPHPVNFLLHHLWARRGVAAALGKNSSPEGQHRADSPRRRGKVPAAAGGEEEHCTAQSPRRRGTTPSERHNRHQRPRKRYTTNPNTLTAIKGTDQTILQTSQTRPFNTTKGEHTHNSAPIPSYGAMTALD